MKNSIITTILAFFIFAVPLVGYSAAQICSDGKGSTVLLTKYAVKLHDYRSIDIDRIKSRQITSTHIVEVSKTESFKRGGLEMYFRILTVQKRAANTDARAVHRELGLYLKNHIDRVYVWQYYHHPQAKRWVPMDRPKVFRKCRRD